MRDTHGIRIRDTQGIRIRDTPTCSVLCNQQHILLSSHIRTLVTHPCSTPSRDSRGGDIQQGLLSHIRTLLTASSPCACSGAPHPRGGKHPRRDTVHGYWLGIPTVGYAYSPHGWLSRRPHRRGEEQRGDIIIRGDADILLFRIFFLVENSPLQPPDLRLLSRIRVFFVYPSCMQMLIDTTASRSYSQMRVSLSYPMSSRIQ